MARELLVETRILGKATPADAYGSAANVALGYITQRWNDGHGAPGEDTHVRNVHLQDADKNHVGFRLYLVWNEPIAYGDAEIEVVDDA